MFSSGMTYGIYAMKCFFIPNCCLQVFQGGLMFRYLLVIIASLSFFVPASWGEDKAPVFTQKDFARLILQQFSWNGGLPKEPVDRDYLLILGGKRTYRYEAETAYNEKTDRVTMNSNPMFGAFTGTGWILGVSDTTTSTFTILLPIEGEYDLKAVIKGNGFVWNFGNKEYRADSKSAKFQEVTIAKVKLKEGVVSITLQIPPEGAIDSFSLSAPNYPSIQPFNGWRFKDGLTAGRLAETVVALTNRYSQLPDVEQKTAPKARADFDKIALPPTVTYTTASYLGPFTSPKWLRADFRGETLQIPLTVAETGYYGLVLNVMGQPVTGSVNDTPFKLAGKPYLYKHDIGLYRLEAGDNTLSVTLPPAGGIDSVQFNKKSSTPDDFLRLSGVTGPADRLVGAEEAAAVLKKIQGSFQIRK